MRLWFDAMNKLGLPRGASFDLDFHTIPFHGEDALIENCVAIVALVGVRRGCATGVSLCDTRVIGSGEGNQPGWGYGGTETDGRWINLR
jgi:hypothetical protein